MAAALGRENLDTDMCARGKTMLRQSKPPPTSQRERPGKKSSC